jgi:hypothetical protein
MDDNRVAGIRRLGFERRGAMYVGFWSVVPTMFLVFGVAWVVNTWIRAKHGYPLDDGAGHAVYKGASPDAVAEQVRQPLESRDATIAKLEERVRVLERIVTDDSTRVAREIESLRTP